MPGAIVRCNTCKAIVVKKSWRYCPFCGERVSDEIIPSGIVWNVIVPATNLTSNWQHRPNTTYRLLFPLGFDSLKAVSAAATNPELPGNTWVIGYFEDETDPDGLMAVMLFEVDAKSQRLESSNIGPCYIFTSIVTGGHYNG